MPELEVRAEQTPSLIQPERLPSPKEDSKREGSPHFINPITKRFKLFNSHEDSDSDSDSEKDPKNGSKENTPADARDPTVRREGVTLPADSELLKNRSSEALEAYRRLLHSDSKFSSSSLMSAQLAALPLNLPAPQYLPPNVQLLINTIPTLDNLATQVLRVVALGPYQKILDIVANQESTLAGISYKNLVELLEITKRIYSMEDPFLSVEHLTFGLWKFGAPAPSFLKGKEETIESTLRKVNLATFLNATLGTIEVGFYYLNEWFLDVFCPAQSLDPSNAITNMHPNHSGDVSISGTNENASAPAVSVSGRLLKSQAVLYLDLKTQAYISALETNERSKEEMLNDIFPENMEDDLIRRKGAHPDVDANRASALSPSETDFIQRCKSRKEHLRSASQDLSEKYEWLVFLKELFEYVSKNVGLLVWGRRGRSNIPSVPLKEERARSPKKESVSTPANFDSNDYERAVSSALLPSEIQEHHQHINLQTGSAVRHMHRRLWSKEEEQALKQGLELKGPQWSQILELFGAGGTIGEALKNRTQVQLKDKARNWKMFFLRSGLTLPSYLSKVTGDMDREEKKTKSRSKATPEVVSPPKEEPAKKTPEKVGPEETSQQPSPVSPKKKDASTGESNHQTEEKPVPEDPVPEIPVEEKTDNKEEEGGYEELINNLLGNDDYKENSNDQDPEEEMQRLVEQVIGASAINEKDAQNKE